MQTVSITNTDVSGIDFGDVPVPQFMQDNQQTILPNTSALHPHSFVANSSGTVSFSVSTHSSPTSLNWGWLLYQDTNCDAMLDNSEQALYGPLTLSPGERVCLLVKVIAPANAANGAMHTLQIQSDFSYGTSASGLPNHQQIHTDITTVINDSAPPIPTPPVTPPTAPPVNGAGKLSLVKSVWNVSRNIDGSVVLPGETLRYTISYENIGDGPLNELIINDSVPEFTQLVNSSLSCTDHPFTLGSCIASVDLSGGLSWAWTVGDKLQAGESGSVSYEVVVE